MISLIFDFAFIGSATVFRFGFDNFGKLSYSSHRGKTATLLIFRISARLKLVKSSGGSMAVADAVAELAEATNRLEKISLNSASLSNSSATLKLVKSSGGSMAVADAVAELAEARSHE